MVTRPVRTFLLALAASGSVGVLIMATVVAPPDPPLPFDPFWLAFLGLPVVGAFLFVRRPGNAVGAILVGSGLATALSAGASVAAEVGWGSPAMLVMINQAAFVPLFFLIPLLVLVFPDGDLPGPRWRWAVWSAATLATVLTAWFVVRPEDYPYDDAVSYPNPLGIPALAPFDDLVMVVGQLGLIGFALAAVVQAIVGYRRSSQVRRLQLKWVLAPAILTPVLFALANYLEALIGELAANVLVAAVLVVGGNGVAVGLAVAVLRYKLYDLDRIISRTVTYTLVVGLVAVVVAGLVAGLALFVPSDDPLLVAIATLAAFALFNPLRKRIQGWVDHRFNRTRYDHERVIDDFAGGLRDRADPDGLVDDWVAVVSATMGPSSVGVWVR